MKSPFAVVLGITLLISAPALADKAAVLLLEGALHEADEIESNVATGDHAMEYLFRART